MPEQPDAAHARPDGVDDETVAAVGRVTEALEWLVRARGALYEFHQQVGHADAMLGEGVELLRRAGHEALADELASGLVGRNALPDRWTFEVVEAFDDTYYDRAVAAERRLREALLDGRRHVHEAEMKARRRVDGPTDDR